MSRGRKNSQKDSYLSSVKGKKDLAALQRAFFEIISRPLDKNSSMLSDPRSSKMISPSKSLTPHERLTLYAQQYWWRLQQSLDEDFPLLRRCLGEKRYFKLRDAYIFDMPSVSYTLRDFGSRLFDFTTKSKLLTGNAKRLALDCLAFEWAKIEAFDAPDSKAISKALIQKPSFLNTTLTLNRAVKPLKLHYSVQDLALHQQGARGQALSNSIGRKTASRKFTNSRINRKVSYIVVFRFLDRVTYRSISSEQYKLLVLLSKGASLKKLFHSKQTKSRIKSEDIFELFREWSSLNWITIKKK